MPLLKYKWLFIILVVAAAAFAFRAPAEKYFDIAKSLDIYATLFKEVNAYYVDEIEPQKLVRKSIDGMLESLDPYTDFIPEDEIESFKITTTGQYGGIGALISVVNRKTVISHPYKDFPAFKAGIKVGDEIVAVDGKPIDGKTTSEISALLKGQPKTDVDITIKRVGSKEAFIVKLKREKINISNLAYYGMLDLETGYVKLDDFTPGAAREVSEAVQELKASGATKLILDLRDNPGGLLHEAVNIVSLFVPKGSEVVSTKGKVQEWNKTYSTLNNPVDIEIPMCVLVSEGSASAAEIVAGALQDYDRAVLVGKKTFGKGLVQTTRPLAYNSQLKVTTAKYHIPSGRCIQALDYAHRKADGSVERFADSTKSEFQTQNGRKVLDGGGLDPDIIVEDEYLGTITTGLINAQLIFQYATVYCSENQAPADFKTFSLSEKEYEQFLSYLKTNKFTYSTPLERSAKQLIEAAKNERYYPELEAQLQTLKSKIEAGKSEDMIRFKQEIKEILEEQIAFNFGLNEGQAEIALTRDKAVVKAQQVLNNSTEYAKLLSPH
ncbi:MAG TPA: S41 family peptidase [Ohtaekwangia sp.]|nr:S41 family peptidase [Ohtaekwangia sp.]